MSEEGLRKLLALIKVYIVDEVNEYVDALTDDDRHTHWENFVAANTVMLNVIHKLKWTEWPV